MTSRSRRALTVAVTLMGLVPCLAHGESKEMPVSMTPAIGEDEALYRCKSRTAEVAVNFKPDMELKELMTWVVGFTCKNFILDPRVVIPGKKVTVIAPNKMSANEAYRLFLVALSTMQLTVVPKGNVLRVTDAGASRRDTLPLLKKGSSVGGDQVVRFVLRPTYAAPDVLVQALTAMKSEIGDVAQIGSMLLLTDYGGNVNEMLALAKLVDVPKGSDGLYTIQVQNGNAKQIAEEVGNLVGYAANGQAAAPKVATPGAPPAATATSLAPTKVQVVERTNTILLAASEAAYSRYATLVKTIDVPLDIEGGVSIHHYRLKNAIAEELAKTLNDTVSNQATGPATPNAPPKPAPTEGGVGTAIDGKVRVIPDKPTNSLIVMSSGRDFMALRQIIAELDQARPQVYIEAMFVEVNLGDTLNTDGSLHSASNAIDKALLFGGVHTNVVDSTNPAGSTVAKGALIGLLGPTVSVLGLSIPSYGVLFNALDDKSRANVLSTPSVLALDNEMAKFKVGKTIPYVSKTTYAPPTSTSDPAFSPQVNIDRIDLNLELEVTPHISSDNTVLLQLKHDSKEEGESNTLGPTWNNRSVETRVLVRDQQTIVIGGMMQEKQISRATQVPFLGDIPLLGHLFKSTEKRTRKSNTIILLTPYIVRNHYELEAIKARKVREHEEFVGSLGGFEAVKFIPKMDYGKKRGLVEEINRSLKGVEEDAVLMNQSRKQHTIPTGPIELPPEE
jgi:general secretion pathway protein D